MVKRKIKIGVLGNGNIESYFSNGLHQNSWLLAKLLNKSDLLDVTLYSQRDRIKSNEICGIKVLPYEEGNIGKENVIFCTSYYPNEKDMKTLKKHNIKVIITHYGNHLYYHIEDFVNFDSNARPRMALWPRKYKPECAPDLVLFSPHFADQRQYFAFSEDLPIEKIQPCPYIWGPQFLIQNIIKSNGKMRDYCFTKNRKTNKNVVMLESNLSFTKTNLIPILITENLYDRNPNSLKHAWVFGSHNLKNSKEVEAQRIKSSLNRFKITREGKMSFESRYKLPFILNKGNVLLSHQIMNSLNYVYLEFAYFRLPFVHNSEMVKDAGYYYDKSNVIDGTNQLQKALEHENLSDSEIKQYNEKCKEFLWKHSIENPLNLGGYLQLIRMVL